MIGAIIGDVVGSIYEFNNIRTKTFNLLDERCTYTDDSVLTIALMDSILNNVSYKDKLIEYGNKYKYAGYGGNFRHWLTGVNNYEPYNSFGNGSAMRISPIGWLYDDLHEVLFNAKKYTEVTHNHIDGIKGAEVVAGCIYIARTTHNKEYIKDFCSNYYNINFNIYELRKTNVFDETCNNTVPQSIYTFLISNTFEDSIRTAISIGGDSDTIACINGSIAEAYYGLDSISDDLIYDVLKVRLNSKLECVVRSFYDRLNIKLVGGVCV